MADEKVRKLAEEALNRLSADLEAGKSESLKNYLGAMSRFHRYSFGNILLISSQRPTATQVAGFHTWHNLDRSVKKGEKGIMIFAPVLLKDRDHPTLSPQHPSKSEEIFRLAGFRTAYVFDISQTEGKPLPEFAKTTGDVKEYGEKLKAIVAGRGITVEYDAGIAPAQGASSGGHIRLMPGMAPAEEFSVLAHELAHEMLHHRIVTAMPPKLVRETQAEAVAFVVCRGVGFETNTAAADYIALYNGDKKTLAESLSVIQETSAKILDGLLPEPNRSTQQRSPESPTSAAERDASIRTEPSISAERDNPAMTQEQPNTSWDR